MRRATRLLLVSARHANESILAHRLQGYLELNFRAAILIFRRTDLWRGDCVERSSGVPYDSLDWWSLMMSHQDSHSPEDDYFNDLSRQPSVRSNRSDSPRDVSTMLGDVTENGIPRPKRIACIICRKRKLKCDGDKPSCGTCKRLGHKCGYDEVRRKSGPKRGYVKELEARLGECRWRVLTIQSSALLVLTLIDLGCSTCGNSTQVKGSGSTSNSKSLGLGYGLERVSSRLPAQ